MMKKRMPGKRWTAGALALLLALSGFVGTAVNRTQVFASATPSKNILENGDFETGDETGWTSWLGGKIETSTDAAASGSYGLKVTERTGTNNGPRQDVTGVLKANSTYEVSYKIKYFGEGTPDTRDFTLTLVDSGAETTYTNIVGTAKKDTWTTINQTITTPATFNGDTQYIVMETTWAGDQTAANDWMDYYLDDVTISAPGLINNSDFETGDTTSWVGRMGATIEASKEAAYSGEYGLKVSGRTCTIAGPEQDVTEILEPNSTYEVSMKIKYVGAGAVDSRAFSLTLCDAGGDPEYTNLAQGTIQKDTWTTLSGTFTTPDSFTAESQVIFVETTWVSDEDATKEKDLMDFYIDDVILKENKKELNLDAVSKKIGNSNPLVDYQFQADPFAMEYDGRLYLYMSSDDFSYDADGNLENINYLEALRRVRIISTDDMVNWTDHGYVDIGTGSEECVTEWSGGSWAPCAAHKTIDGEEKFFLYFGNGNGGIGVLQADSPVGPFEDVLGHALIDRENYNTQAAEGVWWLFDPAVLIDDDGEAYLYYGGGVENDENATQEVKNHPMSARVVKLGDDMISIEGDAEVIDAPGILEDSGIHKFGDKYYYSYCTNYYHNLDEGKTETDEGYLGAATICYMESDSPMGPFTNAQMMFKNPVNYLGIFSNNHHAIFEYKGQHYLAYHTEVLGHDMGIQKGYRSAHIDELTINADGSIEVGTATYKGVSQLENFDPYQETEAETFAWQDGIKMEATTETSVTGLSLNRVVTDIQINDWIAVSGADFGTDGAKTFTVMATPQAGGKIELRTGAPDGTLVGTVEVTGTAGEYQEYSCEVTGLAGVQNLFMVFTGTDKVNDLMKLDNWNFTSAATPTPTPTPVEDYDDVAKDAWYYSNVMFMKEYGIMTGETEDSFGPENKIIRADIATILYRIAKEPAVTFEEIFPDVPADLYFSDPVIWASKDGVVTGFADGKFYPLNNISRQDLVVMMYRYAGEPADKATGDLTTFADDEKIYEYAKEAMQWAVAEGIIGGKVGNIIDPQGTATRAECAAIISRVLYVLEII